MGSWLILAASSRGTRFFAVNQKPPARVPCASAGRRTRFVAFPVYSNGSVPLGAAPEALRAL